MIRLRCTLVIGAALAAGCGGRIEPEAAGRAAVERHGCVSCHVIPRFHGSDALVGPPLNRIGGRTYIAGSLTNTPENMARWVQHPQAIRPGSAMPDLGLTDEEAKDIAAFLGTLR